MNATDCTHSWKTCPVHGTGDPEKLPRFKTVLLCVYGDCKTKEGHLFGETDAEQVIHRIGGDSPAEETT